MTDSPTDGGVLPYRAIPIVVKSWRTLIEDPEYLARMAALWVLGLALLGGAWTASLPEMMSGPRHMPQQMLSLWVAPLSFIFFAVMFVAYASLSVAWMRYVGLGERVDGFMAPVSKQALRLIGYSLLLMIVVIVVSLLTGWLVGVIGLAGGLSMAGSLMAIFGLIIPLAAIFVGVRVSLFYVEIAKSEETFSLIEALKNSWAATRGSFWRLFGGMILTALPFIPLMIVVQFIAMLMPGFILRLIFGLAVLAIQFLSMLAPLSFLTLSHNVLAGAKPTET